MSLRSIAKCAFFPQLPRGVIDYDSEYVLNPKDFLPSTNGSLHFGVNGSAWIIKKKYTPQEQLSGCVGVFKVPKGMVTSSGMVADVKARLLRLGDPLEGSYLEAGQKCYFNPFMSPLSGCTLACTSRFQHGYFHWLLEVLPRVILAQKYGVEFDKIYADQRLSFQRESFLELGLSEDIIIPANKRPVIRCEKLLAFSHWDAFFEYPWWVVRLLRENFPSRFFGNTRKMPRRFYISREDSRGRRLLNEDAVVAALARQGVSRIFSTDFSFSEQVEMFRRAELVVGVHGAGLSNIVFCAPETRVVEICPPRYVSGCFFHLGRANGLNYSVVVGEEFDPAADHGWTYQMEDFRVDVQSLSSAIEQVVN